MRSLRAVLRLPTAATVPTRGLYVPPREPLGDIRDPPSLEFFDGASDGGIAQAKDMSPLAQEKRFMSSYMKDFRAKRKASKLSKEDFAKFTEEYEKNKQKGRITKVPTTIEELPQSDRDWLEGKDPRHPLKQHPFVMKRARQMLAGTWVPAVQRHTGLVDDFKQPLNAPDAWIDYLNNWQGDYWGELMKVHVQCGTSGCRHTIEFVNAMLRAMLRAKQMEPDMVGNLPASMILYMYEHTFVFGDKGNTETWNLILQACAKQGEWRMGYSVEDGMIDNNIKADPTTLQKLDELAQYAWEKGYLHEPHVQNKDVTDMFKVDTRGGVGLFFPMPRGEQHGYALFERHEAAKKSGTWRPAQGTPAWDEYVKSNPEASHAENAAFKAFAVE